MTSFLLACVFAGSVASAAFLVATTAFDGSIPQVPRSLTRVVLIVIVLASALGAGLAPGAPTGSRAVDLGYRVGFGVVVALAGGICSLALLTLGGVATAGMLLTGEGTVAPLAMTSLLSGATLGVRGVRPSKEPARGDSTGLRQLGPLVRVGCAGLLANALLRLPTDFRVGVPTLVAGSIAAIVIADAVRRTTGRARRAFLVGAVLAVMAAGVAATLAGLAAREARTSAEAGIVAARDALGAARRGDSDAATMGFRNATRLLRSADRGLRAPRTSVGQFMPLVGPNLRLARRFTAAGAEVAETAATAVGAVNLSDMRLEDGRIDVDRIDGLRRPVGRARDAVERAIASLGTADGPWTATVIRNKVRALRTELIDARKSTADASAILAALPDLLGRSGPRRYLIVVPTPAEARGSGGLIGNYGEITTIDGRVSLSRFGRTIELNRNGVPGPERILRARPDYIRRYSQFEVSQLWQNVTLSPDFPSAAEAMASLYPQSGGSDVDGIFSADPYALAAILRITGPVSLDGWPEPITAENAPRILLHDWYSQLTEERNLERIDLQGQVASEAWSRLFTAPIPPMGTLGATLGGVARSRHLQLWARRGPEQAFFRQLGVDGSMGPLDSDGFAAVTNNAGANKIEWYLSRTIGYDAQVDLATGAVRSTATIEMRNEAPGGGEPPYVIGNGATPPAPEGTSIQYLSLYSPLRLVRAAFGGVPLEMTSDVELGRNVYSGWIRIPPQSSGTVVAEFEGVIESTWSQGYSLELGCQAMVNADRARVRLRISPAGEFAEVDQVVSADEPLVCRKRYQLGQRSVAPR